MFSARDPRCYYKGVNGLLSRRLSETEGSMARCPQCGGYLQYEPEVSDTPARIKCLVCAWMLYDPKFREEEPRYFPPNTIDRRIEWRQQYPGYDLYEPKSAASQLGISVSFLRYSVRRDPVAPLVIGRGMIACNTPALQEWWDGKRHHSAGIG